jgi:hypothetical protein
MIHKIANLLKAEIEGLNFVGTAVGIAKPTIIKVAEGEEGFIEKRIPVAYRDVTETCDTAELLQMVPDTTKMSIHWWEDLGIEPTREDTYYYFVQANLRLVSWWNLPLINSSFTDASNLVANLISTIPEKLDNTDYLTQIQVMFAGAEPDGAAVVSQYTFNEGEDQFATYPYEFTALNYTVSFGFTKNCVDAVVLNPEVCP